MSLRRTAYAYAGAAEAAEGDPDGMVSGKKA